MSAAGRVGLPVPTVIAFENGSPGALLMRQMPGEALSPAHGPQMAGGVIETDDCRRAYEDLKAKGVAFLQEPAQGPYGIEALMRDDSGNWFSLTQRVGDA